MVLLNKSLTGMSIGWTNKDKIKFIFNTLVADFTLSHFPRYCTGHPLHSRARAQSCPIVHTAVPPLFTSPCPGRTMCCRAVCIITHAPVHINDFRGVRARYVKRTGLRSSDRNAQVKGQQPLWHSFVYLNVWHHNGATIATIVATIATTW